MHDPSWRRAPGWHLPEFLDPDRIRLGAPAIIQSELPDERLRQIAADAIGEDRDLRVDVDAGLEGGLPLAVLVDSAVARPDTDHRAAIEEDLGRRESREDVDAPGLDEPGEPLDERVERDDVVAVILEERRRDRQSEFGGAGEEVDVVARDRGAERRALLLEIRNEIRERRRVKHRAGEQVRAGL